MRIEFFFDVVSPYVCLCWHVLQRYRRIWNFELVLRPVFLGGIMQTTGNQPPAALPSRGLYMYREFRDRHPAFFGIQGMLPAPANFLAEVARDVLQVQRLLFAALCAEKPPWTAEMVSVRVWKGPEVDGVM